MSPKPQRWQQVEELFHQAVEQSPEDLVAWLDRACGGDSELRAEVSSLLESDSAAREGFVRGKVQRAVMQLHEEEPSPPPMEGRRIGPYRLIREIGRGGMGAVYLADRDDSQYESRVAIKLVRPGLDTDFIVRRFRRERQILARLEHPNITRLLDGGTTDDGIPWLVMEFIDGLWITRYAAQHKLSLDDRIRLYLPVCAAVEFAHRHFIVHRDLKPANILIDTTGSPKLLDFGISKLLHTDQADPANTQTAGMMTPDYASPEQIVGDPITIASDVYSLGAVLYELLTGVLPHHIEQCTPLALERAICLDPTSPPSTVVQERGLARRLQGDLDNIIAGAMQKDPTRRYASAEHLAGDLRRYLNHQPVTVRPDSVAYRIGKFVRRNRVIVSAAALTSCAVVGGAVVTLQEARIARQRFEDVRKLATTFVFDVEDAARNLPGSLGLRKLIARTGLDYLNKLARSSSRDWELKRELASAYIKIGEVQGGSQSSNFGDPASALASFSSAGNLLDDVLRHDPSDRQAALDRMKLYSAISNLHRQAGQYEAATEAMAAGLRIGDQLLSTDANDLGVVEQAGGQHLDLARLLQQNGDTERAAGEAEAGARLLMRVVAVRPRDRAVQLELSESHARLGATRAALGRRDEALASYRSQAEVLEALCREFPNDALAHHELMLAYGHLGDTLGNPDFDNAGDLPGARQVYDMMTALAKSLYEADPSDFRALSDFGIALLRLGIATPPEGPEKRATLEHAHELLDRALRGNPQSRMTATHKVWAEHELGDVLFAAGDQAAGVRYYRMAIATAEQILANTPNDSGTQRRLIAAVRGLAEEQARSGRQEESLATLDKLIGTLKPAIGGQTHGVGGQSPLLREAYIARVAQAAGSVYALLGEHENARNWYQRAFHEWQKLEPQKGFLPADRKEMETARQGLK